jgi:hypothetical protein
MSSDVFERLADSQVPPPPPPLSFQSKLHQRINKRLLIGQLLDLAIAGMALAAVHLAKALFGFVLYTLSGRFEDQSENDGPPQRKD